MAIGALFLLAVFFDVYGGFAHFLTHRLHDATQVAEMIDRARRLDAYALLWYGLCLIEIAFRLFDGTGHT